jgi:ribosomal protein S17
MDAASYTYVRVGTDKGDVWAAAPQFAVKVGDRVVVPLEMPMQNFHSQSLNRDFPVIYFVSGIGREGEAPAAGGAAPSLMASHGTSTPEQAEKIEPMAAPANGTTIAELWSKRTALAGKAVTVRGKVVKFNGGILGKNWIHLQDGTGKAADKSNDITITTGEDVVVRVGDTITVTGTVALDKDFGAGYAYGTLIENGRLAGKS